MIIHRTISVAALAVSMAVMQGCATFEKCGLEGCPGDMSLSESVQQSINQHAEFGAPDSIKVMTIDHVVYLNGEVEGGLQKHNAEFVAKQVTGVTKVVNNIAVDH
jgi:osmotically-inducible protein OsmY